MSASPDVEIITNPIEEILHSPEIGIILEYIIQLYIISRHNLVFKFRIIIYLTIFSSIAVD